MFATFYLGCGTSNNVDVEPQEDELTAADSANANTDSLSAEEERRRAELEELYRQELQERYNGRANGVTTYYINAQRLFYSGRYQAALYHINKAAEIKETSDILALRGSIHLALGSRDDFLENWRRALEMDENVPIPIAPFVVRELKAEGLIKQSYNPNN